MTLQELKLGDRVQLHPGTDRWMSGARFGEVVSIGSKLVRVKLDAGVQITIFPSNILEVV